MLIKSTKLLHSFTLPGRGVVVTYHRSPGYGTHVLTCPVHIANGLLCLHMHHCLVNSLLATVCDTVKSVLTGILLRRFLGDPTLVGVTHVVIDEVHERSVDVDLSLLLLRDLIAQGSSIKVIVMSATANAELFAAYFSNTTPKVVTSLQQPHVAPWTQKLSDLSMVTELHGL